ncbi:prepilin-type N-terminal cleavage/methylation domain-containing protein [Wohlfahrtiimonas larvae]|uniref:Prepilin-type N-terminal cleavage/methylation domain-containing protein n=3 Tax=Wohlfahrtiimonas larvae TaxID=1157986 RepID=A0ABP9MS83_9GAMM
MKKNKGFTLIELMITVAIIAIIAMFALPSYQNAQRKARIADAVAQMTELQSQIEKARLVGRVPYNKIELHATKSGSEGEGDGRKVYVRHNGEIRYNNQLIYKVVYTPNNNRYTLNAVVEGTWIPTDNQCAQLTLDAQGNLAQKNYCQK